MPEPVCENANVRPLSALPSEPVCAGEAMRTMRQLLFTAAMMTVCISLVLVML